MTDNTDKKNNNNTIGYGHLTSIVSNHAGSFAAESILFEEFIINHLTNMLTNTTSYKLLEQIQLNDIYLIFDIEPWIIQ